MKRRIRYLIAFAAWCCAVSGCSFVAGKQHQPQPADFACLEAREGAGRLVPLELRPKNIYGMGLTYATHIRETASRFDPHEAPPVFRKQSVSWNPSGRPVRLPDRQALIACAESVEPGLGKRLDKDFKELPALLDYEGELGFVLLEDVDWKKVRDPSYAPAIGYFVANDISARTIAALGEGMDGRYAYWGASKSFDGFLPAGRMMWVPDTHRPDAILSAVITTRVNGEVRQRQSTTDMIYTPRQMLIFIAQKYPQDLPRKGDVVLTGTPSGVALRIPGWKAALSDTLRLDRFTKLGFLIRAGRKNPRFLKPGDIVEVSGGPLGEVRTEIAENGP
ncbi:MAG TPA: fumarylacetoacetate hydrolase family protein [bacterium]|nr:fumarylacetoacetate hydrolase family protein [bacterium]